MSFDVAKSSLLSKLTAGVDFSPKGSIDAPVVQLVDFINDLPDFVTTSSCSGRISVYRDENSTKGIQWVLVVHGAITVDQLKAAVSGQEAIAAGQHFIVLKCEGFILHVRCRDLDSGRRLHQIAMGCGFRESGLSVGQKMRVQLAIRTTAYGLELPIAVGTRLILDDHALKIIVKEANRRLRCNFARTDRLLSTMKREYSWPSMICRNLTKSHIRRWGHCCASDRSGAYMILGGYGVECSDGILINDSKKSTRKLSNLLHNSPTETTSTFELEKVDGRGVDTSMHAASALIEIDGCSYVIITGGRESPQQALPCLRVFKRVSATNDSAALKFLYIAVDFFGVGDLPQARWGHTLTKLGENSNRFLLYGGRDEQQVFGDSYLLTVTPYSSANISTNSSTTASTSDNPSIATDARTAAASVLSFQWCRISSPNNTMEGPGKCDTNPAPRFFHAACFVAVTDEMLGEELPQSRDDEGHNHHLSEINSARVLIHGGLLSLSDPATCGHGYLLCVHTGVWSAFFNRPSCVTSKNIDIGDNGPGEHFDSYVDSDITPSAVSSTASTSTVIAAAVSAAPNISSTSFLRRFGHTITDIGGKTLILAGGVSFEGSGHQSNTGSSNSNSSSNSSSDSIDDSGDDYRGVCAIDLNMSDEAALWGSLRSLTLLSGDQQWTKKSSTMGVHSGVQRGATGDLKREEKEEKNEYALSCRDCRAHHTAIYEREKKSLTLHGGGGLCMSFGAHYCDSVSLDLISRIPGISPSSISQSQVGLITNAGRMDSDSDSINGNSSSNSNNDNSVTINIIRSDCITDNLVEKEVGLVLLVPSTRVKFVKNLLENPKLHLIDKSRRITISEMCEKDLIIFKLKDLNLFSKDFKKYDDEKEDQKTKEKEKISIKKHALNLIVGDNKDKPRNEKMKKGSSKYQDGIHQGGGYFPAEVLMAVPITESVMDCLGGRSNDFLKELCMCLGEDYLCHNPNVIEKENSIEENVDRNPHTEGIPTVMNIKFGRQKVKVSKVLLANGYRKASEYLESVVREYRLPTGALKCFPKKYETVGNILMIPEDSLEGPFWEKILPLPVACSSSETSQSVGKRKMEDIEYTRLE